MLFKLGSHEKALVIAIIKGIIMLQDYFRALRNFIVDFKIIIYNKIPAYFEPFKKVLNNSINFGFQYLRSVFLITLLLKVGKRIIKLFNDFNLPTLIKII